MCAFSCLRSGLFQFYVEGGFSLLCGRQEEGPGKIYRTIKDARLTKYTDMTDSSLKRTIDSVELEQNDTIQTKVAKTEKETATEVSTEKPGEKKEDEEEKKDEETKDEEYKKEETTEKKPESSKFVFGSTTSFGNMGGFKMFGGNTSKNVFSTFGSSTKSDSKDNTEEKSTETKTETEESKTTDSEKQEDKEADDTTSTSAKSSIFGSGSTFGNAFQTAITKKSVFDELKSSTGDNTSSDNTDNEKEKDVYKKVHLEKQDVKSGEENEEAIFQVKAKLYHMELSKMSLGWKERGFGIIKVNKFINSPAENYTSRLVMRQNGNLKLILNLPIVSGFHVLKGMPSSLTGNKFIRLQVLEGGEPVQYAIKVGQPENAEKLFESIEQQIPK